MFGTQHICCIYCDYRSTGKINSHERLLKLNIACSEIANWHIHNTIQL